MRLPIVMLFIVAAALLAKPQGAQAAHTLPWCSVENGGTGPGGRKTCAYESWDQCSASSIGAFCVQNSLYGPRAPGLYYRRTSARKHRSS
jgi:hypothetical protein